MAAKESITVTKDNKFSAVITGVYTGEGHRKNMKHFNGETEEEVLAAATKYLENYGTKDTSQYQYVEARIEIHQRVKVYDVKTVNVTLTEVKE